MSSLAVRRFDDAHYSAPNQTHNRLPRRAYGCHPSSFSSTETATTTVNIPSVRETCFSRVERCDVLLISLINRANRSVYVAVYSFTRDSLATALISAKERGRRGPRSDRKGEGLRARL